MKVISVILLTVGAVLILDGVWSRASSLVDLVPIVLVGAYTAFLCTTGTEMGRDFGVAGSVLFLVTCFFWSFPTAFTVPVMIGVGLLSVLSIVALVPRYWDSIVEFYTSFFRG